MENKKKRKRGERWKGEEGEEIIQAKPSDAAPLLRQRKRGQAGERWGRVATSSPWRLMTRRISRGHLLGYYTHIHTNGSRTHCLFNMCCFLFAQQHGKPQQRIYSGNFLHHLCMKTVSQGDLAWYNVSFSLWSSLLVALLLFLRLRALEEVKGSISDMNEGQSQR